MIGCTPHSVAGPTCARHAPHSTTSSAGRDHRQLSYCWDARPRHQSTRRTPPVATASPLVAPAFDAALAGCDATLLDSDGGEAVLPVRRWSGPPTPTTPGCSTAAPVRPSTSAAAPVGCWSGWRAAASRRLGVDHSPVAQEQCRARGVVMLRRDVFARVPGEGRWAHVLLADGNIGIGGDPARLLDRAARLLARAGRGSSRPIPRPRGTGGVRSGCAPRPGPAHRAVGAGGARTRWAAGDAAGPRRGRGTARVCGPSLSGVEAPSRERSGGRAGARAVR